LSEKYGDEHAGGGDVVEAGGEFSELKSAMVAEAAGGGEHY